MAREVNAQRDWMFIDFGPSEANFPRRLPLADMHGK
jgi:hypothetical protein